jgi:plasmid stabilization system protein ParE
VKPFVVSPNAADDLNSIWLYLATEASEEVAHQTLQRLVRSFAPPICHPERSALIAVIPTGATDSFIVRRVVEGPPHLSFRCLFLLISLSVAP